MTGTMASTAIGRIGRVERGRTGTAHSSRTRQESPPSAAEPLRYGAAPHPTPSSARVGETDQMSDLNVPVCPERQIEMLKNPALKLGTSLPRFVLTVAGRFGRVKRVPASFAMLRPT